MKEKNVKPLWHINVNRKVILTKEAAYTASANSGWYLSSQEGKVIDKSVDLPWRTDLRAQPQLIKEKNARKAELLQRWR